MSFAFGACSGARTYNMASTAEPWDRHGGDAPGGQYGELSQLDQGLLDENTTLVMFTIGGNDAGFTDIMTTCMKTDCTGQEASIKDNIQKNVKPRVQAIVTEVRKRAPNAFIVVPGYPHLFNDGAALDGDCNIVPAPPICAVVQLQGWTISAAEVSMLNRVADFMVNEVLPSDVAHKVVGISTYSYFYGHTVSHWWSSDYLNTVTTPNAVPNSSGETTADKNPIGMGSFHPTADGARYGFAAAVTDRLKQLM